MTTYSTPTTPFCSVQDAINELKQGHMIILVDDEDRENEGDLVAAAEYATPEMITAMTRYASGIITAPMPSQRLKALGIDLMVAENQETMSTAFTVTVDAKEGISTGSSAIDRAHTLRLLGDPRSTSSDFVRPGHINPLRARAGGVLKRPGHTEATIDLLELAGLHPVGVISEIMNDQGEMARIPELLELAAAFKWKVLTIAALVEYRRHTERLITKEAQITLPTKFGTFQAHAYRSHVDPNQYLALVMGDIDPIEPILCRVHSSCVTGDLLGSLRCDCGDQLQIALQRIQDEGKGVLLYIEQEGRGIGLVNKMKAYALQEQGYDTVEANEMLGFKADLRDFGIGAQILADLKVRKVRYMTNNPSKLSSLAGFGLEVTEVVPLVTETNPYNERYLETKRDRMGHLL